MAEEFRFFIAQKSDRQMSIAHAQANNQTDRTRSRPIRCSGCDQVYVRLAGAAKLSSGWHKFGAAVDDIAALGASWLVRWMNEQLAR